MINPDMERHIAKRWYKFFVNGLWSWKPWKHRRRAGGHRQQACFCAQDAGPV